MGISSGAYLGFRVAHPRKTEEERKEDNKETGLKPKPSGSA